MRCKNIDKEENRWKIHDFTKLKWYTEQISN